jgi:hypothetical protein
MRKILFLLFVAVGCFMALNAQDDALKTVKKASRALAAYGLDPEGNGAKLTEATTLIESVASDPTAASSFETWMVRGDIYSTIANNEEAKRSLLKDKYVMENFGAAQKSFDSYKKAKSLAVKKSESKRVLESIKAIAHPLNMAGFDGNDKKDYGAAYSAFQGVLDLNSMLKEGGEEVLFAKPEDLEQQIYLAGITGQLSGNDAGAEANYMDLFKKGTKNEAVYDGLYKLFTKKGDKAAALSYLEAGRKAAPDATSLLFTEINHYLAEGKLDILIEKLKLGISKEPKNMTLYTTLANVYDNLSVTAREKGNQEEANNYLGQALKVYSDVLVTDPKNHSALYGSGSIYFNQAALSTAEINKLSSDYSKEGTKKYDAAVNVMKDLFKKALPFFENAESIDPNDKNTIIALKEIYAKTNELDKSKEFKKRLEMVMKGEKITESYFKFK